MLCHFSHHFERGVVQAANRRRFFFQRQIAQKFVFYIFMKELPLSRGGGSHLFFMQIVGVEDIFVFQRQAVLHNAAAEAAETLAFGVSHLFADRKEPDSFVSVRRQFVYHAAHAVRIRGSDERGFQPFDGAIDAYDGNFCRKDCGIQIEITKGYAGVHDDSVGLV